MNARPDILHAAAPTAGEARRTSLPVPKPDLRAYHRERRLALLSSPRRLFNYIRYKLAKRRPELGHLPIKLDIENVSRCNFACTMCQVSDWPKRQRAQDMSFDAFKRLIDEQYGLVEIKIQGMGEPLLQGGEFFRMIRYARSRRIWVRTTTNASLLHLNDNYRKLIDAGVNDVQVSFDGADKATYEKIRRGGKFEQVMRNCRLLNDYCAQTGGVTPQMWVVVQRDNVDQFFDLIDRAHEMGFRRLTFALNLNDWGQDHWKAANEAVTVEDSVSLDQAWQAVDRGRALGIEVGFWNNTLKYSASSADRLCPWPFERAYVSSDMRIVPCCMIGTPEVFDLGDAGDFSRAWKADDYRAFRQAHIAGEIPRACRNCYEARSARPSADETTLREEA